MNKKISGLILILFIGISLLGLVHSAGGLEDIQQGVENTANKAEDVTHSLTTGEYLSQEWAKLFLGNPVIALIDGGLKNISFLFEILIGMPYSFSLGFFFIIFIWFYFLFNVSYAMKAFSSKGISWALSFFILLLLARLNLFSKILDVSKEFFTALGGFISILPILILAFIILYALGLYLFESLIKGLVNWYKKKILKLSDEQLKQDKALLHYFAEGISNILTQTKAIKEASPKKYFEKYKEEQESEAWDYYSNKDKK